MSKLDMFWASLALIFMVFLMAFVVFVSYIYFDAAMTMKKCMMQYKIIHEYKALDDSWKEIQFEEVT